jgi:pimeloyl-ACP methyl ester carboxylesterase
MCYGTLPDMRAGLRVHHGGSGEPVLLLLHGLGATGDVWQGWQPLLARRWPGRWLAPDLPGHGGSRLLPDYTFESLAAAVAGLLDVTARASRLAPPGWLSWLVQADVLSSNSIENMYK